MNGGRIVDTKDVNVLDLETSSLNLRHDPAERAGGVSTGEDVFVHEETPNEILILPVGTKTGDLEDEDTVIVEEVVDLPEERLVATDTDVLYVLSTGIVTGPWKAAHLSHLKRNDLSIRATTARNVTSISADDLGTSGIASLKYPVNIIA